MCYCTVDRPASRSIFPLALFAVTTALIAGLVWFGRAAAAPAAPAWVPNDSATPPRVEFIRGARYVASSQPAAHLVIDSAAPREPVRLMWLSGRSSQPVPGGSVVLDDQGGVLHVDDRLHVRRAELALDGREVLSVAAAPALGLWVTTLNGEVLRLDDAGRIAERTSSPFSYAMAASPASGATLWLGRSSARFAYRLDSAPPLLVRQAGPDAFVRVGTADVPEHSLLTDLANAGSLALSGDTVYFAPFIRDQVVALRSTGDTVWVASRDLSQSTTEPRFELDGGRAVVDYHPVNLGIAVGPDGNVYVLSTPGFTTLQSRLDVFDAGTGALLRSVSFPTALPTLAVSATGRTYQLDGDRLLASAAGVSRSAAPMATLPLLGGGSEAIHTPGKLSLVNVWASWCAPCREEMPALDSLRRDLAGRGEFRFVSVNEDVRTQSAIRFLDEFGFRFPVLLGAGQAKDALHYPGLPYTILVDGDGRIARKWIGYAGPAQMDDIRAAVNEELSRLSPHSAHTHRTPQ